MRKIFFSIKIIILIMTLSACQRLNVSEFGKPFDFFREGAKKALPDISGSSEKIVFSSEVPSNFLEDLSKNQFIDRGFSDTVAAAVLKDPSVMSLNQSLRVQIAGYDISKSQKDFQVNGRVYSGIEDISDNTSGVALVLSANRVVFDGGVIDARIMSQRYNVEAARHRLHARAEERAVELASMWVDLERYQQLNEKINNRLQILNPLIQQLEKVADAGLGDASKVAAAQRTVSTIKVTQADVSERLEQAKLNFQNSFGGLPSSSYAGGLISGLVPNSVSSELVKQTPAIQAEYARYKAAEATLVSIKAKDNFNVGFESRLTKPFGGSSFDSDESLGLVINKTLFNGEQLTAEISQSEAEVKGAMANINLTYREGLRAINNAMQTIKSMDEAILLSRRNIEVTTDEIAYLRKQLIIGESTLDSVLSGEARLYQAEANEINFLADRRKSELLILGSLGLLRSAFVINF